MQKILQNNPKTSQGALSSFQRGDVFSYEKPLGEQRSIPHDEIENRSTVPETAVSVDNSAEAAERLLNYVEEKGTDKGFDDFAFGAVSFDNPEPARNSVSTSEQIEEEKERKEKKPEELMREFFRSVREFPPDENNNAVRNIVDGMSAEDGQILLAILAQLLQERLEQEREENAASNKLIQVLVYIIISLLGGVEQADKYLKDQEAKKKTGASSGTGSFMDMVSELMDKKKHFSDNSASPRGIEPPTIGSGTQRSVH